MAKRKGMGKGKGKGYKNIIGKDPKVHGDSAKGIKQPQRIPKFVTKVSKPDPSKYHGGKIYPEQTSALYDKWKVEIIDVATDDVISELTPLDFYDTNYIAEFIADSFGGFQTYVERYSDTPVIVKDIKGRGFPDYEVVMQKVADELKIPVEDAKEQFSIERFNSLFWDDLNFLMEDIKNWDELGFDADNFVVVGRSGGYWGLKYKWDMVKFDKDEVQRAIENKYSEDKDSILEDSNYNVESFDNKSDFLYEVTKNITIDNPENYELIEITDDAKKQFEAVDDFIEGTIKDYESPDRWVDTILANEYVEVPPTPFEKAQQEPTQTRLPEIIKKKPKSKTQKKKKESKKRFNELNYIMDYESGNLSASDTLVLFSNLIKNGHAWTLQGHYGRTARGIIDDGFLTEDGSYTNKAKEFMETYGE